MLYREIEVIYKSEPHRLIIEASVAMLRFWLANPNFRSVLMLPQMANDGALDIFDLEIISLIDGISSDSKEAEVKKYTVRSLLYGTLMLIGCGALENCPETIGLFRKKVENEISETH